MSGTAGIAILLLGVAVAFGLVLVALVRREGPTERGLDWESAENVARQDTDDGNGRDW